MPSLTPEFISKINEKTISSFPVFVETGTYHGETVLNVEPLFETLYTIEIKKEYYENAKSRYHGNKIFFIHGDSSKELGVLVPKLKKNTVFFLDGHWSAGDTGRGDKDCPLYEELAHIAGSFLPEGILIIDDVRLFGKGPKTGEICDWESINETTVDTILGSRVQQKYSMPSDLYDKDRLIFHLRGKL